MSAQLAEPDWATASLADVATYTHRAIARAFLDANAERQALRDPTAPISMSSLGGCTKYAAFKLAGWEPSDDPGEEEAREALLGIWIHEVLLPLLAKYITGAVVEEPVELHAGGLTIPGILDLANDYVVWDLKTVKEWRLAGVRRLDAAFVAHWLQEWGYAYARWQARYPVRCLVWIYFDRSTGEVHVEIEEFVPPVPGQPLPFALAAIIRRAEELRFWAKDPKRAPRELARVDGRTEEPYLLKGPGLSVQCDRCEFLRACWDDTAVHRRRGAQRVLTATPEGIAEALAMYARGATLASEGKGLKDFAKAALAEVPDGEYPDPAGGAWTFKHGRPSRQLDEQAVRADYAARGIDPPTIVVAGRTMVKRAAKAEGEV